MNGVYLFGLQLLQIKLVRYSRKKSRRIKPFSEITNRMQITRNKNFGTNILSSFKNQIKLHFTLKDEVTINGLVFTINNSRF